MRDNHVMRLVCALRAMDEGVQRRQPPAKGARLSKQTKRKQRRHITIHHQPHLPTFALQSSLIESLPPKPRQIQRTHYRLLNTHFRRCFACTVKTSVHDQCACVAMPALAIQAEHKPNSICLQPPAPPEQ